MNFQIDPEARQWIIERGGSLVIDPTRGGG